MINDITIILTTVKPNSFSTRLNSKNERVFKADGKLSLQLKLDNYYIHYYIDGQRDEQPLLEAYQNSKILDENLSRTISELDSIIEDMRKYNNNTNDQIINLNK